MICIGPDGLTPTKADRARTEAGWHDRELITGHDAMATVPRNLADPLLEVAAPK